MRLPRLSVVLSAVALVAVTLPTVAIATSGGQDRPTRTIRAGYGVADATWNVGAAAGQYARSNGSLAQNLAGGGDVDPHAHSTTKERSYGVQSRLSVRAIVVEGLDGNRVALLKSDNYLAQDLLLRRVGQLLGEAGSEVAYDDILHSASHNHSSPYYSTTSPGVWIFQDAFDQRMFEYQARAVRDAILAAEKDLRPARMAATTVEFSAMKGNVVGEATADDGTPAGYPRSFGDNGLVVMRFDALEAEPGRARGKGKGKGLDKARGGNPIAVWMNFGQHPESLDGYGLTTSDFIGPVERFVERETGAPLVFSQGDVGSAEGPYESWGKPEVLPDGTLKAFAHVGYAQMERGARQMADAVVTGFEQAATPDAQVPWSSSFPVQLVNAWVPGPVSHPYPSVGNCRTDPTLTGNPGVGVAPNCERTPNDPVVSNLDLHGLPIPDQYGAPGYPAVEENMRLRLQVARFGEVLLASCACEAQVDLILNLESRANAREGDIYDGYDWSHACRPDGDGYVCKGKKVTEDAYDRMLAQVHNDARGWDAPEYAPYANSESADPKDIKGNFTKEELPASRGFALPVGLGHAGDYNGYTVSYREYASRDHYRKALTAYGPHTADYMVTRLVRMAGSLKGGPQLGAEFNDAQAQADEVRQATLAKVIGAESGRAYDAWRASLPDDLGPAAVVTEPRDLSRFDATTFTWRGGSNALDNPVVRVERQVDGAWESFADMSGEVQTQVAFPKGIQGVADTRTGRQEWIWTAAFEAYSGFPTRLGSTPEGSYRFVVEGLRRAGGKDVPYALASKPFRVSPWSGVQVADGAVDEAGNVSFRIGNSVYPRTWSDRDDAGDPPVRTFPTIRDDKNNGGRSAFCRTCSFRPWASTGTPVSAVVTVTRADGTVEQVPARSVGARWVAETALADGDRAGVEVGAVRDSSGETNGIRLLLR